MLPDSLFVSPTVHARTVELGNGESHTLYFRELAAVKFAAYQEAKNSKDEDIREGSIAKLIAASVCEADGSQAMDYERAKTIKPGVMNAMMMHILEINGYGVETKKG